MLQMAGHLQSPLRPITALVVHALLMNFCRGQPQLIGPAQPIEATVGSDIMLPCHLKPAVDVAAKTLVWTRPDLDPRYVFLWNFDGQEDIKSKNPSYSGRTSLFTDELKRGNISLKLSNVKPGDEGTYICFIPELREENSVELVVGAASLPVISFSLSFGPITVQCDSTGWYPEPELFLLDGEGNLLSRQSTKTVRGPDGLYTVSSSIEVIRRDGNSFTCRVTQKKTNQTRETQIYISVFYFYAPVIYSWIVFIGVLLIILLSCSICSWEKNKKEAKRRQKDETEEGRKNRSKCNKSGTESVTEEGEAEQLMTHDKGETQPVGSPASPVQSSSSVQPELQKEKKEREEDKKEIERLKQELQKQKSEQKDDTNSDSEKA